MNTKPTTPTSAQTAEVKAKPAAKTQEQQILNGIKTTWAALKNSDKAWAQNGKKFGKWCSDLRKFNKKQGSRKGLGFEATLKKLGVDYQKARYWADVFDGKAKAQYAGDAKSKSNGHKNPSKPQFALAGLTEAETSTLVERAAAITPETASRLMFNAVMQEPGDLQQVRAVVNRCLAGLSSGQQLEVLKEHYEWIEGQIRDFEHPDEKSANGVGTFVPDDEGMDRPYFDQESHLLTAIEQNVAEALA